MDLFASTHGGHNATADDCLTLHCPDVWDGTKVLLLIQIELVFKQKVLEFYPIVRSSRASARNVKRVKGYTSVHGNTWLWYYVSVSVSPPHPPTHTQAEW